jgi:hypothetical protein
MMKRSRGSRPKQRPPKGPARRTSGMRPAKTHRRTKRLIDKLQVLALRRPNAMRLVEIVVEGLLNDRRRDDPRSDDGNGPMEYVAKGSP